MGSLRPFCSVANVNNEVEKTFIAAKGLNEEEILRFAQDDNDKQFLSLLIKEFDQGEDEPGSLSLGNHYWLERESESV